MPYLVLVLLSPTTNAAFACLWMLVSMAAIVPAVLATALFPVAVADPGQARHNILMSLSASFAFSVVCALVVFLFSRDLLALFNPAYPAIAGDGLGLLGFGLLGLTLKFHICALARLGGWMRRASLWFAFGAALEFASVAAGARFGGLSGLVLGWVVAGSAEGGLALVVLLVAVRGSRPTVMGPPDAIPMARREVGSASPASPSEVTASALSLPDPGDTLHEHRRHDQRNFAAPTSRCLHSLAPWRLNRVRW
jgi:hypothetical protein